jgi:hypothetical protein
MLASTLAAFEPKEDEFFREGKPSLKPSVL